ncbi:MAG: YbjQ family protein [Burkholderiaceae bacterium]|nr:YbjQ family protein [Burkholderiaceae bacterium]
MAVCSECGSTVSRFDLEKGLCGICAFRERQRPKAERDSIEAEQRKAAADLAARLDAIMMTTETAPGIDIAERIEIISAECVFGMNVFKDIGSSIRDLVGGRNKAFQDALREARKTVLSELRKEALEVGADAVVAVDLDYSEVSGGGKSMMFLVASGTAVKMKASSL